MQTDTDRLLALIGAFLEETRADARSSPAPRLDSHLERDLGVDSLGRIELALRIERAFGVRLPDGLVAEAETPLDLLRGLALPAASAPAWPEIVPQKAPAAPLPTDVGTLVEMLEWHVALHPDRLHITLLHSDDGNAQITYAQLLDEARVAAGGLQAIGLAPGQSAAIMLGTSRQFFVSFFAILLAGAVPVPIYPPTRWAQVGEHMRRQAGILDSAKARVLVTVKEAVPLAHLIRGSAADLARIVTVDDLRDGVPAPAVVARRPEDVALLQYTSGSTGNPKGVILTHANLLANIRAMGTAARASADDTFVSWLPLYHDMGLIGAWLGSLCYAMPLVVMSPLAFLSRPARWLQAISRYRATLSAAPNFAYEICASKVDDRDLEGLDLSCWRWAFNGAEPVNPHTAARFARRFERYGFDARALAPVYGLAECGLDLAFPLPLQGVRVDHIDRTRLLREAIASPVPAEDPRAMQVVACGRPLPGYDIRIADAAGHELPERHEGRIEFRGPSATVGYFRNPEATARLFDGDWLDTGDLGYLARGEVHVTGRAKDVVIRGGQHLHPQELEEAVGELQGVRKGCVVVFGVPDATAATERLVVLAETREEDVAKRAALTDRIRALSLDMTGSPADEVVLAPPHAVPKTSSGKIRRAASRELYLHGLVGRKRAAVWRQLTSLGAEALVARIRNGVRRTSVIAYAGYLWCLTAAIASVAVPVTLFPDGRARIRALHGLARALVRASGLHLVVAGGAQAAEERPVIVVSNHCSYVDAVLLFAALAPRFAFTAKRELARNAFMKHLFVSVGTRFVERHDVRSAIEDTRALVGDVRAGQALVFFPEGTFQRNPGLLPFRMGAFVIAAEAGVPVIPVAITGTRSLLPAGSWFPRRADLKISIGPSIAPVGNDWAAATRLRDLSRNEILRMGSEPDLALADRAR